MAKIEHLSHSSLEDVKQCSWKWALKKVHRVPQIPGWSLIAGKAVHDVTEALDKLDFGMPVESEDLDFYASLDRLIREEYANNPDVNPRDYYAAGRRSKDWPNKENEDWWRHHGPGMVERWKTFKNVSTWDIWLTPEAVPAIELALNAEYGGVPVKGFLDRIMQDRATGDLIVLDIKTGANEPKSSSQLKLYGDMVAKLFGEEHRPRFGCYWMARTGSCTPPVELGLPEATLDREYRTAARIITLDLFLPSPGMLCGSCSVRQSCASFVGHDVVLGPVS